MNGAGKLVAWTALVLLLTVPSAWSAAVQGPGPTHAYALRPPIVIQDELGFHAGNGVVAGSGTPAEPYVIQGWEVRNAPNRGSGTTADDTARVPGCSITIEGTSAHVVVSGNRVTHAAAWNAHTLAPLDGDDHRGICIRDASNVTVSHNHIEWVQGDGMLLQGARNVTVEGNRLEHTWEWTKHHGIVLLGGTDITLRNNSITGFAWGLLGVSPGVHVAGNVLDKTSRGGVKVTADGPILLEENTFLWPTVGVRAVGTDDLELRGNLHHGNDPALHVKGDAHVVARNNTLLENDPAVLAVDPRSGDAIGPTVDVRWNWWGAPEGPGSGDLESKGENVTILWDPPLAEEPNRHVGGEAPGAGPTCFPAALCHPDAWKGPGRS